MKRLFVCTAIALAALTGPAAFSQDKGQDKHAAHMQEKMKEMQGQMDKIRQTTDPAERQKLMQEHSKSMQANMEMMRSMGGASMKGAAKPDAMGMAGKKEGMAGGDMMKRHEMMERRVDMMQMMMEQMMQHGQVMESMPAK